MDRIPSLDGSRAISILLVIVGHAYQGVFRHSPEGAVWIILGNGSLGVEIFFVISGFLITALLVSEQQRFGGVSLRNFYVRRCCRIFPPYYLYILLIVIVEWVSTLNVRPCDVFSALSFTWDYSPCAKSWVLAHTWSLSIEEQFYLLWPPALVFLFARSNRNAAAKVVLVFLVAAPFFRISSYLSGHAFMETHVYSMLHTRADSLMFGCLLALLAGTTTLERIYMATKRCVWICPVFFFLVSPFLTRRFGGAYIYTVGFSLEGAAIALTLLWLVRNDRSAVGRILNSRILVHVGLISYSLYIWQQLFLHPNNTSLFGRFPLNLCFLVIAAELSYFALERRCLELRRKFELPRGAARLDTALPA
jgi:peptidoglycan/LPS O-acetylase OafA/YrhL